MPHSPESRTRFAELAMSVINEHPNPDIRKLYAGRIAAQYTLSAQDLINVAERRVRRPQFTETIVRSRRGQRENAEFVAITQLVQDWNSIAPWLVESLFADELYRRAFLAIAAASGDLGAALQQADPEAREVLERAAVVDLEVDAEVEARNLIGAAVRRELGRTASTGDPRLELDDREARLRLEDLGVQERAADAAEWLLVWLAGRTEGR
jgi:DNA primase